MNLLSIDEVAAATGLSRSTLAKRRCAGTGPGFFKLGRQVKYSAEDLENWILAQRRTSTWRPANDNNKPSTKSAEAA